MQQKKCFRKYCGKQSITMLMWGTGKEMRMNKIRTIKQRRHFKQASSISQDEMP